MGIKICRLYSLFLIFLLLMSVRIIVSAVGEEGNSENSGGILVYSTMSNPNLKYTKSWFDTDLPYILTDLGYSVQVTDRISTPEITISLLNDYDELWIITSGVDDNGCFNPSELNAIFSFRNQGNGIFLMTDHDEFQASANQISIPLGVRFHSLIWRENESGILEPDFEDHTIFNGVTSIVSGHCEGTLDVSGSAEIIATENDSNLIAVLNDGLGRVVFDVAFPRLFDDGMSNRSWITVGDTSQYVLNIVDWLMGHDINHSKNFYDFFSNKAMYIEGNIYHILETADNITNFFDFCQNSSYNINTLFFQVNEDILEHQNLQNFLNIANEKKIFVHALAPKELQYAWSSNIPHSYKDTTILEWVDTVLKYNNDHPIANFSGIHLDIEVDKLEDSNGSSVWVDNQDSIVENYLLLLKKTMNNISDCDILLSVDIDHYYDTEEWIFEFEDNNKSLSSHIMDIVDFVTIREYTDVVNEIIYQLFDEMEYAKENNKSVIVTFATQNLEGEPIYFNNTASYLDKSILDVWEQYPEIKGFAVHKYSSYKYFRSTNEKPIADASDGEPYEAYANDEITFNGSKSFDPDGEIVEWFWDFGDGTVGTGEVIKHSYSELNTYFPDGVKYIVDLRVTDNEGAFDYFDTVVNIKPSEESTDSNRDITKVNIIIFLMVILLVIILTEFIMSSVKKKKK